jgi:hypothetical protein
VHPFAAAVLASNTRHARRRPKMTTTTTANAGPPPRGLDTSRGLLGMVWPIIDRWWGRAGRPGRADRAGRRRDDRGLAFVCACVCVCPSIALYHRRQPPSGRLNAGTRPPPWRVSSANIARGRQANLALQIGGRNEALASARPARDKISLRSGRTRCKAAAGFRFAWRHCCCCRAAAAVL